MFAPRILRIAVAAPLPGLFDYLPPPSVDPAHLQRGVRLRVPFGRGSRIGFLWDLAGSSELPAEALKSAEALLDQQPLLPPDDLALLRWAADYYQHPLGDVLLGALPQRLRKKQARRPPEPKAWRLTAAGRATDPASLNRAPRQAAMA